MKFVQCALASLHLDTPNFPRRHPDSLHHEPQRGSPPRRRFAGASVRNSLSLAALAALLWAGHATAATFASGSLVVERVGDGSVALVSGGTNTPVFLLEFP